jgi:uncharacterized protein YjbJ (UPF0337 family)
VRLVQETLDLIVRPTGEIADAGLSDPAQAKNPQLVPRRILAPFDAGREEGFILAARFWFGPDSGQDVRLMSESAIDGRRRTRMGDERAKGSVNKARGKLEEGFGKLTGNKRQQATGKARQVQSDAEQRLGDIKAAVRRP